MIKIQYLNRCFSLCLGSIFIYAGMVKAFNTREFADTILNFRLLNYEWSMVAASCLPYIEMAAGILMFSKFKNKAARIILLLSILFIGVLGLAISNGLNMDCGCFGRSSANGNNLPEAIVKNILILSACVWILRPEPTPDIS
ncbi:MAG: hypothetical protein GY729_05645 [Desulfobacteraceae bacterium]|nr:hypothetical protein [Desulfobacteraceae bacterium]